MRGSERKTNREKKEVTRSEGQKDKEKRPAVVRSLRLLFAAVVCSWRKLERGQQQSPGHGLGTRVDGCVRVKEDEGVLNEEKEKEEEEHHV
ncbi:hypothetical protein C0Q70_11621 [Pomacea canaliculata]|uniref:Uncharacterized protein n=1 Tax=Pomacea canaliculata TaxID=400727 RepID=A0A2T7P6H2_POMCA|nr:hypothetical protein C0Q70_11621 [Pomacea canaliculata]